MSSTRKGLGPMGGPVSAHGVGEGVVLSGGEARAVSLEVDDALHTHVLPALLATQQNNNNDNNKNKNNGGWTRAVTKGRVRVDVKQNTQGPPMLRATTTVVHSSTTPQESLSLLRQVMHSPAHVCSVLQCLFPDIEAAKIAAKVVEEEVGGSSLRGGSLTRSGSRLTNNNSTTNTSGTSSVLRVTWAPRKHRAQELLLGQRTGRVVALGEGDTQASSSSSFDCHVIAPITCTERVPSLCVGSSVEGGPVLAIAITQHDTIQGAIDITLLVQGVSSLLLHEPKRMLTAAGSLVWLLCELPSLQRVLVPYASPSPPMAPPMGPPMGPPVPVPVLSFMSPRATRHRTLLCLPNNDNDNEQHTQSSGVCSWRHVSVRFVCPSSGSLSITGLAIQDQDTLKALHAPPLPLTTRFKATQVVEVQLLASTLTKDLTLSWSGLCGGVGLPVYTMSVRGLGAGPERGLCLLYNTRMLTLHKNKHPLTLAHPHSPSPNNANTPPSVSVLGRVCHLESWLLWFRLQLPGVKHLALAPGPYALVSTLCAPVSLWELLWDMTWPILLTPASFFALLYCVHEDTGGLCLWLLEHDKLSLWGLGAMLLVVHVLSTLTLHLALTAHFRRLRERVGLEWAVVGERLGTRILLFLHLVVATACVSMLSLLASLLALAPIEPAQGVAQQPLPLLRGAATVILMYSGVSEAAHSKLLLVTLEYVTLVGLGSVVALGHWVMGGSRALGLSLVLALCDLGLLKHKTMPPVTFTGSIKESGLALLEVQEGLVTGGTGNDKGGSSKASSSSSRRSLTPASEEHIKKLVAEAIEKMKETDPEGVKRVSASLASPLLPPPSPSPLPRSSPSTSLPPPPLAPQSSSSLRRLLSKSRPSSSSSSSSVPPAPSSPKALSLSPRPSNAGPMPMPMPMPPSPKAKPSASVSASVSPSVSPSTPEAIATNNVNPNPTPHHRQASSTSSGSGSVAMGGGMAMAMGEGEGDAFGESLSPDARVMDRPQPDRPMTMAGTVWQERLTGGVLTGGRYKVWKELWLSVEGDRIKLYKRRDEGEAKKDKDKAVVIHYDWPIDKVHVAEVVNDRKAFRVIWPLAGSGLVSSPGAVDSVELRTEADVTADKWRAVIRWNQLVYNNKHA